LPARLSVVAPLQNRLMSSLSAATAPRLASSLRLSQPCQRCPLHLQSGLSPAGAAHVEEGLRYEPIGFLLGHSRRSLEHPRRAHHATLARRAASEAEYVMATLIGRGTPSSRRQISAIWRAFPSNSANLPPALMAAGIVWLSRPRPSGARTRQRHCRRYHRDLAPCSLWPPRVHGLVQATSHIASSTKTVFLGVHSVKDRVMFFEIFRLANKIRSLSERRRGSSRDCVRGS
jgi:hypothetical protein